MTKQGLATLIDYSLKCSNKQLEFYLKQRCDENEPAYVHQKCRRDFTNARRIKLKEVKTDIEVSTNVRRSQVETFQWKTHCLFCSKVLIIDDKHPGRHNKVVKAEFCSKKSLLDKCIERGDKWADDVKRRLTDYIDLVASDAVYHKQCKSNFFTKKKVLRDQKTIPRRLLAIQLTLLCKKTLRNCMIGWRNKQIFLQLQSFMQKCVH